MQQEQQLSPSTDVSSPSTAVSAVAGHAVVSAASRRPPKVLEEDTYVSALSTIIERDYFPNLTKMKVQNEYLNAVQCGEYSKARAIGAEIRRMGTGEGGGPAAGDVTPAGFDFATPRSTSSVASATTSRSVPLRSGPVAGEDAAAPPDEALSLDAFQTEYTSEDNASFSTILDKVNAERRAKYAWVFDKEKGQLALAAGSSPALALEHVDKGVAGWKYKAKNSLMYYPDGVPLTHAEQAASRGPPKGISHSATRFAPTSSTTSLLRAAQHAATRAHTNEVWSEMAKATPGLFGPPTPEGVNGFSYVPSTPLLDPEVDVDPTELMTWGSIEGTPLLVDSGGGGSAANYGKGFSIPDTPRREALSNKLSGKATKNLRNNQRTPANPFAWSPRSPAKPQSPGGRVTDARSPYMRSEALSPAAKHLLNQRSQTSSSLLAPFRGGDPQLRASYSMTPKRSASRLRTSTPGSSAMFTPDARIGTRAAPDTPLVAVKKEEAETDGVADWEGTSSASITDNLLQF
ncbi:DiGeorge syndrome critical region protein 14 [Geranomyces variabilis]|uniref:DiGeorge syndrome critical region protein 14 n=1 Tax=Geranomyces variabilis TaxID=109894 RepID=A0AAD5TDP7_9FUNG|nr:DiGeorge syndrome critical region protein 14 [Geranomyces variabilis]